LKAQLSALKERYLYSLVFLAAVLGAWQAYVVFFSVPGYLLPSPYQVLAVFRSSGSSLARHALVTLQEVLCGYAFGAVAGFLMALAVFSSGLLRKTVYPLIIAVQSIPKLALAPLFVIWFGFGIAPKIAITALVVFFPVLVHTIKGLSCVTPELLDLLNSLRASKLQILLKIRIPASMPYLATSLKASITLGVLGAVIGEFVGADKGLGYVIMVSSVDLDTSRMFAALSLLGAMGLALFAAFSVLERLLLPWCAGTEPPR